MRRYVHEVVVNTPPETLWRAIVDIRRWPEWDAGLETIELRGELAPGCRYTLKPRGGPAVAMSVEAIEPPNRFVDLAHLPLAFFWDRVVARKIARDAGAQTEAFVRFAGRPS